MIFVWYPFLWKNITDCTVAIQGCSSHIHQSIITSDGVVPCLKQRHCSETSRWTLCFSHHTGSESVHYSCSVAAKRWRTFSPNIWTLFSRTTYDDMSKEVNLTSITHMPYAPCIVYVPTKLGNLWCIGAGKYHKYLSTMEHPRARIHRSHAISTPWDWQIWQDWQPR